MSENDSSIIVSKVWFEHVLKDLQFHCKNCQSRTLDDLCCVCKVSDTVSEIRLIIDYSGEFYGRD